MNKSSNNCFLVILTLILPILSIALSVPAAGEPIVFWANDPVGPDDSVVVCGSDLLSVTKIKLTVETRPGDPTSIVEGEPAIQQITRVSVKFIIPADFPRGAYRYELQSSNGDIAGWLNRPTIFWATGDLQDGASAGGWIRIIGRNIWRTSAATLTLIGEGTKRVLSSRQGGMWDTTFAIPIEINGGSYKLILDNGFGNGVYVDTLEVKAASKIASEGPIFDIHATGAVGDGTTDDTTAIQQSLDIAGKEAKSSLGRPVVSLAAGRYLVSRTLFIPPHVILRGEATDRVNLVWLDRPEPLDVLISGLTDFSVEKLTIYASNHGHGLSGGFVGDQPFLDARDISVRNVRIRISAFRGHMAPAETYSRMSQLAQRFPRTPSSIRISGRRISVEDNDVVGSGGALFLYAATDVTVRHNRLANGRYGWYSFTGCARVLFEENDISSLDLQGTGGGFNTLAEDVSGSANILVRNNVFHDIYGWDREAFTTDGPGGYYFGPVSQTGEATLHLNDKIVGTLSKWSGAQLFVVSGRGLGQCARVRTMMNDEFVTLDHALQAPLDSTSRVAILQAQTHYVVIGNRFVDSGVAVQFYGTALDSIIAENVSIRTGGFFTIGKYYHHLQPNWYVQILNNTIEDGNAYMSGPDRNIHTGRALIGAFGEQTTKASSQPGLVRAVIIRGNDLGRDGQIQLSGISRLSPGVSDAIVEHNKLPDHQGAVVIDEGVAWSLIRSNAFVAAP